MDRETAPPMDRRLRELQLHFSAVLDDLEGALGDIHDFEQMMSAMNDAYYAQRPSDVLTYAEPITRWFARDLMMTIRRLADDDRRRGVLSLIRLLRAIRRLSTRDICGVPFNAAELDADIESVQDASAQAVDIANGVIAHRGEAVPIGATFKWRDLFDSVTLLARIYDKYAARFYANWAKARPEHFPAPQADTGA